MEFIPKFQNTVVSNRFSKTLFVFGRVSSSTLLSIPTHKKRIYAPARKRTHTRAHAISLHKMGHPYTSVQLSFKAI